MSKLRLPIWQIMGFAALVALGLGALRSPTALTAGCVLTLTVGLLLFALVGAIARQGNGRLPYLGFTAFGTGYLVLAYLTGALALYPRPILPTNGLLDYLGNAFPIGNFPIESRPSNYTNILVQKGTTYVPLEKFRFDQIGHYLFALLIGLFGSVLARVFRVNYEGQN